MMSLFNSFDFFYFKLHSIVMGLMFYLFFMSFYKISYVCSGLINLFEFLNVFVNSLKPLMISKNFFIYIFCLMNMIFFLNVSSMFPYNFSLTSQLSLVIFLSFCSWMSIILMFFFNNLKYFISHCIPEGSPIYLVWVLFLIEMVSNIIRPITLTVRLVANILAGHLLMILLSKIVLKVIFLTPIFLLLNLIELFVSLIQSYIFVTMVSLYYCELN